MAIINQNRHSIALPNFCNMGIGLRVLVIVNLLTVIAAALRTDTLPSLWQDLLGMSATVQPILLASLVLLCLSRRVLETLPYHFGVAVICMFELMLATAVHSVIQQISGGYEMPTLPHYWFYTLLVTAFLLGYFHLRSQALSPALTEARLQALQARIRPHFLFNSINAVLSLVRSDPKRAERALEDMADLFRVLMADNRQLTTLEREVELCREYLDLEQLRLGERLQISWHIDKMPKSAMIPPLVLQPLLENAVYHGIEPSSQPGEISINIYTNRNQVHIVLRNPYQSDGNHHAGNKMALQNIRERLDLHFDAEASLATKIGGGQYQVHITIPLTTSDK
jgi:two-component system sensor histidine kinase AlgZ